MVTLLLLKSSALKPDAPQRTAGCVHGWQLQDGAADDDAAAPCGMACVNRERVGGVVDGGGVVVVVAALVVVVMVVMVVVVVWLWLWLW